MSRYYHLKNNSQTIGGIDPIYPSISENNKMHHSDGVSAGMYKHLDRQVPLHYERFIKRRVNVPWLARHHEWTFLNATSEKNKDQLPGARISPSGPYYFKMAPVTGNDYANLWEKVGTNYKNNVSNILEGFGKSIKYNENDDDDNDKLSYIIVIVVIAMVLMFFITN